MLDRLIHALVKSRNEAADDVLLDALRLGTEREQRPVLTALLRRATVRGLGGVVGLYDKLPEPLQLHVLRNIKVFHPALRECAPGHRSDFLFETLVERSVGKRVEAKRMNLHLVDEQRKIQGALHRGHKRGAEVADAKLPDFAGGPQVVKRKGDFLRVCQKIRPVQHEQVDGFDP